MALPRHPQPPTIATLSLYLSLLSAFSYQPPHYTTFVRSKRVNRVQV